MIAWIATLATLSGIVGAWALYLASPQQRWRSEGPWPARRRWWPALSCLALSLAAMTRVLAPFEAVAAWAVLVMFVCSLAPFLGAWRERARAGGAS